MKHIVLFLSSLMLLCALNTQAQQYTITGKISSANDNKNLALATVCLQQTNNCVTTSNKGNFKLEHIKPGKYTVTVSSVGYLNEERAITVDNKDVVLDITLNTSASMLDSVEIKTYKQSFGMTRLNDVDGSGIYAGKKSEVIVMKDVTANKATNNTRQIYAKVAGLNIYENDGGAGIQLAIGGRGLDPNRVSNFNTRQNGYDISADALGYPESYYTPPAEAVEKIEVVRGASSLQYGTQFGGIINFKMNSGTDSQKMQIIERLTGGSWKFFNTTTSVGGTVGKLKYYALYQHKSGDGWRPNSGFNVNTFFTSLTYKANRRLSITTEVTHMDYMEQQAGGLNDAMFAEDPRQSTKARNWFRVNWNLGALMADYKINDNLKFNTRFFGLLAERSALGVIDKVTDPEMVEPDGKNPREYRTDTYHNWGNESRLIYTYNNHHQNSFSLLGGMRYYQGNTNRQIGMGNSGYGGAKSDFAFDKSTEYNALSYSKYTFPEHNIALFAENIFKLSSKFSIIPGIRYENITTNADGFYNNIRADQRLNVLSYADSVEHKTSKRSFFIGGLGFSFEQSNSMQFYANISQNYRAINFNNISIVNPNYRVDPNMKDETGYSADIGMRGHIANVFTYDLSLFYINYNDRIGTINLADPSTSQYYRYTTNISKSRNLGLESYAELDVWKLIKGTEAKTKLAIFSNLSLIDARYLGSEESAYHNTKVEFVPPVILKTGLSFRSGKLSAAYQFSYTAKQFGDATNAETPSNGGINGPIPAYYIMDLTADYMINKIFMISASLNNLTNNMYFTRRADSYPGPGIIPADGRSFYCTLQVKL